VAAVALGVGGFVAFAGGDDDPGTETDNTSDTTAATDTTQSTDGSTVTDGDSGPAMPASLQIGHEVPLRGGGDGVDFDSSGRLWVTSIDPETVARLNEPNAEGGGREDFDIGDGADVDALALTYDYGHIWVTERKQGKTLEIDPDASGAGGLSIVAIHETPGEADFVTSGGGYIWVLAAPNNEPGAIYRITPDTGEIKTLDVGEEPRGLVVDHENRVWVTQGDSTLQEYTTEIEPVGAPITVGDKPDEVGATQDHIWVANRNNGTVSKVSRQDGTVVPIEVGGNPAGLEVDGDRIWVVDTSEDDESANGHLILIDGTTGDEVTRVDLHPRPLGIKVDGDQVWVTHNSHEDGVENTVTRVDASA
jgi:streptogramin lyase